MRLAKLFGTVISALLFIFFLSFSVSSAEAKAQKVKKQNTHGPVFIDNDGDGICDHYQSGNHHGDEEDHYHCEEGDHDHCDEEDHHYCDEEDHHHGEGDHHMSHSCQNGNNHHHGNNGNHGNHHQNSNNPMGNHGNGNHGGCGSSSGAFLQKMGRR